MKLVAGLIFLLTCFSLKADIKSDIKALHDSAYTLLDTNLDFALEIGLQAQELADQYGLIWEEANSIFIQAWVRKKQNESGKAFMLYLKAIELLRPYASKQREADLISVLLSNIGIILYEHHAKTQADQFLDEGINIASKYDLPIRLANLYFNKARLYRISEQYEKALGFIETALEYAHSSKQQEILLLCLNLKGLLEQDLRLNEIAINSFETILKNISDSGIIDSEYTGIALHNIGNTYAHNQDYVKAKNAYIKSLKLELRNNSVSDQFLTLTDLCEVSLKMNSTEEALNYGSQALALYSEVKILPEHYQLFDLLAQTHFELKNFEESRRYSKRYIEENNKFLKAQEELLKTKDQFQMELLSAGFFVQQKANQKENLYLTILSIITSIFTIILIAGMTRQYYIRKSIRKALIDINLDL